MSSKQYQQERLERKQEQKRKRQTADCTKMWDLIREVRDHNVELSDALADTFCEFECAWKEHADEYHTS